MTVQLFEVCTERFQSCATTFASKRSPFMHRTGSEHHLNLCSRPSFAASDRGKRWAVQPNAFTGTQAFRVASTLTDEKRKVEVSPVLCHRNIGDEMLCHLRALTFSRWAIYLWIYTLFIELTATSLNGSLCWLTPTTPHPLSHFVRKALLFHASGPGCRRTQTDSMISKEFNLDLLATAIGFIYET